MADAKDLIIEKAVEIIGAIILIVVGVVAFQNVLGGNLVALIGLM